MARELKAIDISGEPELLRIVEQVRSTREPLVLRQQDEDVAILRPLGPARRRLPKGRPTSATDPLWRLVGIGASEGPGDVSINKHKYLADAYADLHK
ncbi:MAG: hypothetical protein HYX94_03270 [Chloroflexi bacterium]|nr:hypothetical protein [Chloroflexota bacterium]